MDNRVKGQSALEAAHHKQGESTAPNLVAAAVVAADDAARLPVLKAPVDDHTLAGLVKPPGSSKR